MSLQPNSDKDKFLADVAFGIALAGTAQRGEVYRRESSADERKNFRSALRRALENLAQQYDAPVADDRHISNIDDFARTLSKRNPEALNASRFRIGSAQKALNLYLKMLWCFDRIPMPPHCPFDRVVLSRVPGCESVKWTQLDSLPEYEGIAVAHAPLVTAFPLLNGNCTYTLRRCLRRALHPLTWERLDNSLGPERRKRVVTNLVRRRLNEFAPPHQLNRWASFPANGGALVILML